MKRGMPFAMAGLLLACSSTESKTECPPGSKRCGDDCVANTNVETGCASSSCEPCPKAPNGTAVCVEGQCALGPCMDGYGDCDGIADNGCEVALASDVDHCGGCKKACDGTHGPVACLEGACALDGSCDEGWADCNADARDGCETDLKMDPDHCGACDQACGAGAVCSAGVCDESQAVLDWLAARKGGWCLDQAKLVNLCGKVSHCDYTLCGDVDQDPPGSASCYEDLGHEHERAVPFCCDPTYFRDYPGGLALDVGFHYDGDSAGRILDLGGDKDANRVSLGLVAPGQGTLKLVPAERVDFVLTEGTHLLSVRVTPGLLSVFLDGVLVGTGTGLGQALSLVAESGPGFVLGSRISFWWEDQEAALRFAPFFLHLRDAAGSVETFDFDVATTPQTSTVVLFDGSGVEGNQWNATVGDPIGFAVHKDPQGPEPVWVEDAFGGCL